MRIVFFGTDDITLPTFSALLNSNRHEIPALVSQPDRLAGRGRKLKRPAIVEMALDAGIEVIQKENLKGRLTRRRINSFGQDINVVFAYGCYVPSVIFENPEYQSINIHPSLLPCHRGPNPIRSAISCGDAITGVSIQYLEKKMDTGAVLASREVNIDPDETHDELNQRLAIICADLLIDTLEKLKMNLIKAIPQDETCATECCKWEKSDTVIDWTEPGRDIHNRIRAFSAKPGARTIFRRKSIIILKSSFMEGRITRAETGPGAIAGIGKREMLVAVDGGALAILELKPEGKNGMDVVSFLNGFRPETGEKFG